MKLTYMGVPNTEIPSFAYLICEDDGKLFIPIFDINNTVLDFKSVDFNTSLIEAKKEQQIEIEKGDYGLFAYYYNEDIIFIADAEELVIQLLEFSKKQNMSEDYLISFEAFAKKYNAYTVYLIEYCKHYGYSDRTVKLLAHAATDNTNTFAKKWALKAWARLQEQRPEEVSNTIRLNRTLEGEVSVGFAEEDTKKSSVYEVHIVRGIHSQKQGIISAFEYIKERYKLQKQESTFNESSIRMSTHTPFFPSLPISALKGEQVYAIR